MRTYISTLTSTMMGCMTLRWIAFARILAYSAALLNDAFFYIDFVPLGATIWHYVHEYPAYLFTYSGY